MTFTEFRPFLISFKLHRCTWDQDALATCINDFRGADVGNIRTAISKFAVDLARCISSQNNGVQNSAASKIAFFAKPCEEVYIWDQHAMRSAAFRGRPTKFSDYATFHESCTNALHAERQRQDFVVAVQDFRDYLRHIGGPMASRDILCDSSFVERRLLDKLMFCEGKFLKPKKSATSCRSDHSAESVPA